MGGDWSGSLRMSGTARPVVGVDVSSVPFVTMVLDRFSSRFETGRSVGIVEVEIQ